MNNPIGTWSKPYCGVTHLNLGNRRHQVTVCDYGSFANYKLLHLAGEHPFNAIEEKNFETVNEACNYAEKRVESLWIMSQ